MFKTLSDPAFIAQVKENSDYLISKLEGVKADHGDKVTEIRGRGLIVGAVLSDIGGADAMNAIREESGVVVCVAGPDVVRFLPPLVVEKSHIDEAVGAFASFLEKA